MRVLRRRRVRDRDYALIALVAFVVAFAIRFAWVMKVQSPFAAVYSDMGGYVTRADELLGRVPTLDPKSLAFYPWGTHTLIAGEFALWGRTSLLGVAITHAFVGALQAPCVALVTARFVRGKAWVAVAAGVAVLWQPLIAYCGFFMSEMWYATALLVSSWLFLRHLEGRTGSSFAAGVAIGIATVIRPQILFTCALVAVGLLPSALRVLRRPGRGPTGAWRWALVLVPIAIILSVSAARFHQLTGRYGLVADNGPVNRLFADTEIGKIEAHWTGPMGHSLGAWYAIGNKGPYTEANSVYFWGYIGDPVLVDKIRRERLKNVSLFRRLRRNVRNIRLLLVLNFPYPEEDFSRIPWRAQLQRIYANATMGTLPLAAIGLLAATRRQSLQTPALLVAAHFVTIAFVAAFYYAGARFRVPYDPYLLVAATAGLAALVRSGVSAITES